MTKSQLLSTFDRVEHFLDRHHIQVFWAVFVTAFLLIVSRKPDLILHAQFWAEDGRYWYADVYNHGWRSLFYLYDGYLVFFYHLVAFFSLLLPLKMAPLFFNIVAILVQLLPIALINSNRLRNVIPYRSLAILISLLYVGIPNANEVFGNLTNAQWHLGVASFLVLIAASSKSRWWLAFDIGVLLATGLSGPLVIMLLPVAILLWWQDRTPQRKRNLLLLGILSVVQLVTIFMLSSFHRVGGQPGAGPRYLVEMIVGQTFTGGLLGQEHVKILYGQLFVLIIAFIAGLSLIIYAVIRGPLWMKLMNLFALLVFISMLVSLKPLPGVNLWQSLTDPSTGQRYWYIPILSWLMTLLWIVLAAGSKSLKTSAGLLLVLLVVIGMPGNWKIKSLANLNFSAYTDKFQGLPTDTQYSIPINPVGWQMTLHKK
jgi:hypothetical protein